MFRGGGAGGVALLPRLLGSGQTGAPRPGGSAGLPRVAEVGLSDYHGASVLPRVRPAGEH